MEPGKLSALGHPSLAWPHLASPRLPYLPLKTPASTPESLCQTGKGDGHWEARAGWVQDPGPTTAPTCRVTPSPSLEQSSSSLNDPTATLWGLQAQALLFQELSNSC